MKQQDDIESEYPDSIDAYTENKEAIIEKIADNTMNRETAIAYLGYLRGLSEADEMTSEQFGELIDLLPLTKEDYSLIDF